MSATASCSTWLSVFNKVSGTGAQVRNKDDVLTCARHMHTDSLAPVFLTSSVTGEGLELVRLFYNLLPQRHKW